MFDITPGTHISDRSFCRTSTIGSSGSSMEGHGKKTSLMVRGCGGAGNVASGTSGGDDASRGGGGKAAVRWWRRGGGDGGGGISCGGSVVVRCCCW